MSLELTIVTGFIADVVVLLIWARDSKDVSNETQEAFRGTDGREDARNWNSLILEPVRLRVLFNRTKHQLIHVFSF